MTQAQIKKPSDLAPFIEHTLLKAEAQPKDIKTLCEEAQKFGLRGVCVNSRYVSLAKDILAKSNCLVVSVVGFPLGAMASKVKAMETRFALEEGADEIDMVIALGLLKAGLWQEVENDIQKVAESASGKNLKVILETGMLDREEIVRACLAAEKAGAQFVKTATGFLGRGASLEDIQLMRQSCSPAMEIKASGGVKTFVQAKSLIEAGATRIGTSSGPALVKGQELGPGY